MLINGLAYSGHLTCVFRAKVDMFKAQNGSITITSQEYDYDWEEKSGFLRNIASATRGELIGTGYMIKYYNYYSKG